MDALISKQPPSCRRPHEKVGASSFSDFHSAFDHAPVGMAITDVEGTMLLVNPAMGALLHSSPAELVGTTHAER